MKKIKIAALAVVALMSAGMLCACGEETVKKVGYELPHYDGTARRDFDSEDKPYYNSERGLSDSGRHGAHGLFLRLFHGV